MLHNAMRAQNPLLLLRIFIAAFAVCAVFFVASGNANAVFTGDEFNASDFRNVWTGEEGTEFNRIGGNGTGKWNVWLQNWWKWCHFNDEYYNGPSDRCEITDRISGFPHYYNWCNGVPATTGYPAPGYPTLISEPSRKDPGDTGWCREVYGTDPGNAVVRQVTGGGETYLEMKREGHPEACDDTRAHRFLTVKSAENFATTTRFQVDWKYQITKEAGWGFGFQAGNMFRAWYPNSSSNVRIEFDFGACVPLGCGKDFGPGDFSEHTISVRGNDGTRNAYVDFMPAASGTGPVTASGGIIIGNNATQYGGWDSGLACAAAGDISELGAFNDGMGSWPGYRVNYIRINNNPNNGAGSVLSAHPLCSNANPSEATTFETRYYDPDGAGDIRYAKLHLDTNAPGAGAPPRLTLQYDENANSFSIVDGAANVSFFSGTRIASGNPTELILQWTIAFNSSWQENVNVWLYAEDELGLQDGWEDRGAFSINTKCVVEGACRDAVPKACSASSDAIADGVNDSWCTENFHDLAPAGGGACRVVSGNAAVSGQIGTTMGYPVPDPNTPYWEGESCGADPDGKDPTYSDLLGEKTLNIDDINKYSRIETRIKADDSGELRIGGVPRLTVGCCNVWSPWTDIKPYLNTGANSLQIFARDVCSGARLFAVEWNVVAKPDLVAENLGVSGTLTEGYTLTLSGRVRNQGGDSSIAGSTTEFRIDGSAVGTQPTGVLAAGGTEDESLAWVATVGSHTFSLCADTPGNAVDEGLNEGNNCTSSPPFTVDAQNLSVLLTPPSSSTTPLSVTLSADVLGTALGTINYSFWWNCNNSDTSVALVSGACGALPIPVAGSCTDPSNATGFKCDGVVADPQTVLHTYIPKGTYYAKVIAERGTAPPAESRATEVVLNSTPVAAMHCDDTPDIPPGVNDCTIYTTELLNFVNDSTDADGLGDIISSAWQILLTPYSLNCPPGPALCNWAVPVNLLGAGTFTMRLTVTDADGATSTATLGFIIKQDAIANFRCSLDGATLENCDTLYPRLFTNKHPDITKNTLYLHDESTPSALATITSWTWTFLNAEIVCVNPPPGPPQCNAAALPPSISVTILPGPLNSVVMQFASAGLDKNVTLTVTDDQSRTDGVQHLIDVLDPLPEWIEITPRQ